MQATKAAESKTGSAATAAADADPAPAEADSAPPAEKETDADASRRGANLPAAAAALSIMDEPIPFTNLNEALVKADTAGVFASPSRSFVDAKSGRASGRSGSPAPPAPSRIRSRSNSRRCARWRSSAWRNVRRTRSSRRSARRCASRRRRLRRRTPWCSSGTLARPSSPLPVHLPAVARRPLRGRRQGERGQVRWRREERCSARGTRWIAERTVERRGPGEEPKVSA